LRVVKKLHWLFIKSFIGPFIGTFFIALFLLLMQTIWKYLEDLVGKGLEISVILEFIFYFAIHLIPMALPLAILLSSIMVFGNLAEQYELVAIKAAGVSLLKAMRPMFIISILMAIGAFYTANKLIPKANLSWGALLYDVTQKKPAMNIVDNVFFKDIDGYAIRVGKKHADNQTIDDVIIYVDDVRNSGNNNILVAKRGKMTISNDKQFMTLHLEDGSRYQEMVDDPKYPISMPHNIMAFKSYDLTLDLSELAFSRTDKDRFSEDHRMMNLDQLDVRIDSLDSYIYKKKNNLYNYIIPYFHQIRDSALVVSDTGVQARLAYLLAYSSSSFTDTLKTTKIDTQIADHSFIAVKPKTTDKIKTGLAQRASVVSTAAKEAIIEKALQNANNVKNIASNNVDDFTMQKELRGKYLIEWHRKFTLACSCILLFFVGAPLGAIIKKGGFGLPLVISILLFILYYVIGIFGEKLALQGELPAAVGMWLSMYILLPLAIFLTYKASRDSQLFDADSYKRFIRKITPKQFKEKM
jgi:lipopolysaccharide export system permease protein